MSFNISNMNISNNLNNRFKDVIVNDKSKFKVCKVSIKNKIIFRKKDITNF
jgi:hypothetical protein